MKDCTSQEVNNIHTCSWAHTKHLHSYNISNHRLTESCIKLSEYVKMVGN